MTGWIIAGSLGFSTILALTFVLYELRNAMELPDDMDPSKFDMFPVPPHMKRPPASEPHAAASLRIKRQFN